MIALDMNSTNPEAAYLLRQICLYTLRGDKPACAEMSRDTLDMILTACAL